MTRIAPVLVGGGLAAGAIIKNDYHEKIKNQSAKSIRSRFLDLD